MAQFSVEITYPNGSVHNGNQHTAFRVGGDSAAEYLLHPVFLQFAMLCLALLALLDQSFGTGSTMSWQVPLIWLATAGTALLAGVVLSGVLSALPRRMVGRRRYTPLVLFPVVAVAEVVQVALTVALQDGNWPTTPELGTDFARSAIVVLILDVMHALYVVPLHPLARPGSGTIARLATNPPPAPEAPAPDMAEPAAADPIVPQISIADRRYAAEDILWIRTEDHYLNVVTAQGRSLLRAKLSDLQSLQDGRIGMQVNRSHWVAFAAIREIVEEDGGQITLRLVTGDDASVARSRRIMFRQMVQVWRSRQER